MEKLVQVLSEVALFAVCFSYKLDYFTTKEGLGCVGDLYIKNMVFFLSLALSENLLTGL